MEENDELVELISGKSLKDQRKKAFKRILAFILVYIVSITIVPIPVVMLDILLAVMFGTSLLFLIASIAIKKEHSIFSRYPAMFLLIILLKLALNIIPTRLILSEAEAGQVIEAFGGYVTAGNIIVGTIMFLIIVIINFVVITKGSTRIAEVAARFILDAMPGKQMAIDADLNAGHITEEEAKKRREDISREADFYGAMDGASKFVRIDVIASAIVIAIDIIGGIILGISNFMELAIGHNLVILILNLMIAIGAKIMVTRTLN